MSLLLVTALGLFGFGEPAPIQHHSIKVVNWTVTARFDRFTGQTTCYAKRPGVQLKDGVVTFFLGEHIDTTQAMYRLDFGQAYRVSTISSDSVTFGRPIRLVALDNPSDGQVGLPVDQLRNVSRVDIQPKQGVVSRPFFIKNLGAVIDAERRLACPAEGSTR